MAYLRGFDSVRAPREKSLITDHVVSVCVQQLGNCPFCKYQLFICENVIIPWKCVPLSLSEYCIDDHHVLYFPANNANVQDPFHFSIHTNKQTYIYIYIYSTPQRICSYYFCFFPSKMIRSFNCHHFLISTKLIVVQICFYNVFLFRWFLVNASNCIDWFEFPSLQYHYFLDSNFCNFFFFV